MAQFINTNIASLNAQRNLSTSQSALATSLQRLSSGLRINSAKDDAAGLAISSRMTSQINGLNQARRNANDGVSLAQTGEAALATSTDMLQRIRQLAVQSANATNTSSDRAALQAEANQLTSELQRTSTTTQFNGQNLLDGSLSAAVFQVGANANQTITATTSNFQTTAYGNFRIGASVAATSGAVGDLTTGSTASALASTVVAGNVGRIVAADNFTINGASGTALITGGAAGDTAKNMAALVNAKTVTTGVTASAKTEADLTGLAVSSAFSIAVKGDNATAVTVSFNTGAIANADGLAAGIKAFNDVTSTTGITAKLNTAGTGFTLTSSTGANINLVNGAGSAAGTFTGAGAVGVALAVGGTTAVGQISLDSNKSFGITGATAAQWLSGALTTASSQLQQVAQIDISSADGANRAIAQADAALASVNDQRASYGALQSRFSNAIANLMSSAENLTAARSRIQDTNFAAETGALTRAQILQRAGTAMLAQANAVPNGVMALLR